MDGSPRTRPRLSVVLPARDEEQNLEGVVHAVVRLARPAVSALEIVVVDDGSRDRTAETVERLGTRLPEVRLVSHGRSRGYGAALRSGIEASRYEWVFYTDADGQFPLAELPAAIAALTSYDAVVGFRIARADGVGRRFLGRAWTELVRRATGLAVRDANCAFKLFPKHAVRRFPLRSEGAAISAEILLALARSGLRTLEIGVAHVPRRSGSQTGARASVALTALSELGAIARDSRSPRGSTAQTLADEHLDAV